MVDDAADSLTEGDGRLRSRNVGSKARHDGQTTFPDEFGGFRDGRIQRGGSPVIEDCDIPSFPLASRYCLSPAEPTC